MRLQIHAEWPRWMSPLDTLSVIVYGETVKALPLAEAQSPLALTVEIAPAARRSGSVFKIGHGYILSLPVAAYLSWRGDLLEGKGVSPHIEVELFSGDLKQGRDPQMERAVEMMRPSR